MLLTDRGVQRGELFADTAYVFDDNTRFELRKVTRDVQHDHSARRTASLSADRGKYNMREQKLEGFGNVVIVTNEGKRLTSPHIDTCRESTRCRAIRLHAGRARPQL